MPTLNIFKKTVAYDLLRKAKALTAEKITVTIYARSEFQEYVISLNTDGQLFAGIDALNTPLNLIGGDYSINTVRIKQRKNQPFDRVTLKDTGEFYDSFRFFLIPNGFMLDADTFKDGADLQERWGANLIGLTDESIEMVVDKILENTKDPILKSLLARN